MICLWIATVSSGGIWYWKQDNNGTIWNFTYSIIGG